MFETALTKASAAPDRSLMIGDRYSHDMEGGANAGMWTISYGADAGPAVDFTLSDLQTVVDIVDGTYERKSSN
jgi:putative hydrolase of the HAD superfamily